MNSYHTSELPYMADSRDYMVRLSTLPQPIFLDSCQPAANAGRYDILSALPIASITVDGGQLTCSQPLPEHIEDDLFAVLAHLMDHYCPEPLPSYASEVPFVGGLLGYLGYPSLQGLGAYQIDNAFLGIYLWALVLDHHSQSCNLFFLPGCTQSTRVAVLAALEINEVFTKNFRLLGKFSNDMSKALYHTAFSQIKDYIQAGDCYQVNLTQRVSSHYVGDPLTAYLKLRQMAGKPFSAYLAWGNKALLSLSPERFLQVDQGQVITQPIKGTRPRGSSAKEDQELARELVSSEKDRAENLMIVDLLRNDLGTVCEFGSISASPLFELQSFSNVHHLVSTVGGTLKDSSNPLELLKNCFPGGSVTGAPKLRAMAIIEELEPHRRDAYCGSVLYLGFDGRMDSNITIRTLLCNDGNIYGWAGGGIVADSECDQEYLECFDKIQQLINILQQ